MEAIDIARRAAAATNGRGACSHPDGTTRMILSALDVFTEDLATHVFHSSCGRPVRGVLPLPSGSSATQQKHLLVDWVRCEGHGLCAHLVPELIHLDSNGFPVVMDIPVPPWLDKDAAQAVEMCPALALRLGTDHKKAGAGSSGSSGGGRGSGGPPPIRVSASPPRSGLLGGTSRPAIGTGRG
jgi:ferredoxin